MPQVTWSVRGDGSASHASRDCGRRNRLPHEAQDLSGEWGLSRCVYPSVVDEDTPAVSPITFGWSFCSAGADRVATEPPPQERRSASSPEAPRSPGHGASFPALTLLCWSQEGGLTWEPHTLPGPRARPPGARRGGAPRPLCWFLGSLEPPGRLGRQEGMPAKGKALLDLTKFKLPSGGPPALHICEAEVTGLPETKFLGSPGPRGPPWRDKKCDLRLLLRTLALA